MESVSTFYQLENDYVYLKGKEEGEKKATELQRFFVIELLQLGLIGVKQIAKMSQTKVSYVKKIQKELNLTQL